MSRFARAQSLPDQFIFDGLVSDFSTQTTKCPPPHANQVYWQSIVDANGTGFRKIFDCATGAVVDEEHRLNGHPDGVLISRTLKGQFKAGSPDGIWIYRDARQTFRMDFTGGNGYWIVPASWVEPPLPYHTTIEEGAFVNGKRDGIWFTRHVITGQITLHGEYVGGERSGLWRQSTQVPYGFAIEKTFANGKSDGPFTYWIQVDAEQKQLVRVEGEQHGDADIGPFGFSAHQIGDKLRDGTISGVWRYYDPSGKLILQNDLVNGTGHFVIPSIRCDGTKSWEGDVVNGKASGSWISYDDNGRPAYTSVIMNDTWQPGITLSRPMPTLQTFYPSPAPPAHPAPPGQPGQPGQPGNGGTVTPQHGFMVQFTGGTDSQIPATIFVRNGATGKSATETVGTSQSNLVCATTLERTAWSVGLAATLTGSLGGTVRIVQAGPNDVVTVSGCVEKITTF
jgi:antitoxin component YwqK of YwqJK toxin-antitoxin module